VSVVIDPTLDAGVDPRRQLIQGFDRPAAQSPRADRLVDALCLVRAHRRVEAVEEPAVVALDSSRSKLVPQELIADVLMGTLPPVVLAVHDARLVRIHLQPALLQPAADSFPHVLCLPPAYAVDHHVVAIPLEANVRELLGHPAVERIVHEQVRQQR